MLDYSAFNKYGPRSDKLNLGLANRDPYPRNPAGARSQEHRDDRAILASVARLHHDAVDRLAPPQDEESAENRTDTTTDTSELESMETGSKSVH